MTYPEKILVALQHGWTWLALNVHPLAPWLLVPALAFSVNWAIRTWAPHFWQTCTDAGPVGATASKVCQALPSVAMGAIIVSLGAGAGVETTVLGAVAALAAPLWHELLKWATSKLPGPTYYGGNWPAAGAAPIDITPRIPPGAGLALLVLSFSLPQVGCAGSLVDAQRSALSSRYGADNVAVGYAPSQRCQDLSDRHTTWGAVAEGAAILSGASGVSALPAEELPEHVQGPARYTAAGISLGAAAVAAAAAYVANDSAAQFAEECIP